MYIYDNVVIFSSMWYVLRFEHAHGLKRYNERRMTRGQTTCSLGGTASLGLLQFLQFLQFLLPFSRKRLLLRWIVDVVKDSNSDATFRLLMSGDINRNPGPVSASTAGKINCLEMNA